MEKMARIVLPFKIAETEESMTAQAGLLLFGEFQLGVGVRRWMEREMPKPGSGHAYSAFQHAFPLFLMLAGGGRSLEDLRMVHPSVPCLSVGTAMSCRVRRWLHGAPCSRRDGSPACCTKESPGCDLRAVGRVYAPGNQGLTVRRVGMHIVGRWPRNKYGSIAAPAVVYAKTIGSLPGCSVSHGSLQRSADATVPYGRCLG